MLYTYPMSTVVLDREHSWRLKIQAKKSYLPFKNFKDNLPKSIKPSYPIHQNQPKKETPIYYVLVDVFNFVNLNAFRLCGLPCLTQKGVSVSQYVAPLKKYFPKVIPEINDNYIIRTANNSLTGDSKRNNFLDIDSSNSLKKYLLYINLLCQFNNCKSPSISNFRNTSPCYYNKDPITCFSNCYRFLSATNMHAQPVPENSAVITVENLNIQDKKESSLNIMNSSHGVCQNSYQQVPLTYKCSSTNVTCNTKVNMLASRSSQTETSITKNGISSSLPLNLESSEHDIVYSSPQFPKRTIATKFTELIESKQICSKSDSYLLPGNFTNSEKSDGNDEVKFEFLNINRMRDSSSTEEESLNFDSGQEDNLELNKIIQGRENKEFEDLQASPRLKKTYSSHTINQSKNLDINKESSLVQTILKVEDKIFPESRRDVYPYTKGNSRGNVGGKNKSSSYTRRRLLDDEGFIRRAACICVNKEETKVLLISSKKDRCAWLVPGGGLEVGEDPTTAAIREAWEEAGVLGHITKYLGLFESYHHSGLKKHRTSVYIFTVTEEHHQFPEARLGRTRQWFSMDEALIHLTHHRPLQSAYLQVMMMPSLKVAASS